MDFCPLAPFVDDDTHPSAFNAAPNTVLKSEATLKSAPNDTNSIARSNTNLSYSYTNKERQSYIIILGVAAVLSYTLFLSPVSETFLIISTTSFFILYNAKVFKENNTKLAVVVWWYCVLASAFLLSLIFQPTLRFTADSKHISYFHIYPIIPSNCMHSNIYLSTSSSPSLSTDVQLASDNDRKYYKIERYKLHSGKFRLRLNCKTIDIYSKWYSVENHDLSITPIPFWHSIYLTLNPNIISDMISNPIHYMRQSLILAKRFSIIVDLGVLWPLLMYLIKKYALDKEKTSSATTPHPKTTSSDTSRSGNDSTKISENESAVEHSDTNNTLDPSSNIVAHPKASVKIIPKTSFDVSDSTLSSPQPSTFLKTQSSPIFNPNNHVVKWNNEKIDITLPSASKTFNRRGTRSRSYSAHVPSSLRPVLQETETNKTIEMTCVTGYGKMDFQIYIRLFSRSNIMF